MQNAHGSTFCARGVGPRWLAARGHAFGSRGGEERAIHPPMRTLIFDLDGTLLDSLDDIAVSLNHVLAELGLPQHEKPTVERFVGDGARMLIRRALPAEAVHREDEVLSLYQAHHGAHLTDHSRLFPGVPELLEALTARSVQSAVLTNKPHAWALEVIAHFLPAHPFAAVFGQREGHPAKPDPTVALQIAAELEGPFGFVGDTPIDIHTAKAARMRAIGVSWGMRPVEELRRAGADVILESPAQLLEMVASPS